MRLPGLVLFAASLRPLLAHPAVARRLHPPAVRDVLLAGLPLGANETLVTAVREVLAGEIVHLRGDEAVARWFWDGLLEPPEGDASALAGRFREALVRGVERSVGRSRPVAVTLSGGIDSAAVAASAVEAFGADAVVALSYEFDDPAHGTETAYAREVCRHLGIRRHRVFRIRFEEFLAAIPETVWRAESVVHWPKAFMVVAARRIRDEGFDRYLSGFGVGSHMAFYEDLARVLEGRGGARLLERYWRLGARARLERVHPALAPPGLRLLHFLGSVLGERGVVGDPGALYPAPLRRLRAAVAPGPAPAAPRPGGGPLLEVLRRRSFAHLVSCIDVTRWEKVSREVGALRLSPAHLAEALPYAYLPYRPRPPMWSEGAGAPARQAPAAPRDAPTPAGVGAPPPQVLGGRGDLPGVAGRGGTLDAARGARVLAGRRRERGGGRRRLRLGPALTAAHRHRARVLAAAAPRRRRPGRAAVVAGADPAGGRGVRAGVLVCAGAALALAACGDDGRRLSSEEIRALFSERVVVGYHENQDYDFRSYYDAEGRFASLRLGDAAPREGRWWVTEEDRLCIRWVVGDEDICRSIVADGDGGYRKVRIRRTGRDVTIIRYESFTPGGYGDI